MSTALPVKQNEHPYRYSRTLGQILQERVLELDVRRNDPERYKPIPTHITGLNEIFGGFPVGEPFYMLIYADEKLGKTTLAQDLADAWRLGNESPILYVQAEELSRQYADRHIARHTSLNKNDIRGLKITDEQMKEMEDLANELCVGKDTLYIQDDLFTIHAIIEEAKRLSRELSTKDKLVEIKDIVIDNFGALDSSGFSGANTQERLSAMSKYLLRLRNQEGYSFIVVAHMSTSGKAFGSTQTNKDADLIVQLDYEYTKTDEKKGSAEPIPGLRRLIVHPSRISGAGVCTVAFDGAKNQIRNVVTANVNSDDFLKLLEEESVQPEVLLDGNGGLV